MGRGLLLSPKKEPAGRQRSQASALPENLRVTQRFAEVVDPQDGYQALRRLGLTVTESQANFVLVDFRRDGMAVFESLLREGVLADAYPSNGVIQTKSARIHEPAPDQAI